MISAFSWVIKVSISFFMSEAVRQREKNEKKEISKPVHSRGNILGKS